METLHGLSTVLGGRDGGGAGRRRQFLPKRHTWTTAQKL